MSNGQIDFLHIGEQKGYIELLNERKTIHYVAPGKKYKFTDPEEEVRARYYVELIERYQYPEKRIDLEVSVPGRTPYIFADIVVFQDNDKKAPFIVVECKKDEISEAKFSQAIQQAFGNCNAFRGHYAAVIAGNTRRFFNVKDFASQERDRNVIADIPIGYGKVQEWRYKKNDDNWDLQAVGREDLIRVLDKCHNTLRNAGQLAPTEAFDELSKILFIKIRDEKKPRRGGDPYDFQIKTHETPKSVANRIKGLYQEAKTQDPKVFTRDIEIDARTIFSVVTHLQGINLNATELDVKGLAFERFLGNYFKGDMGQYFTPRELVEFIIKMVEPHYEKRILDPACGSGGFLLYAMEHIQKEASDFYDEASPEHRSHWHAFARDQLFGIEVNDAIARVAKMNMILHDDGHSNVIGSDALINFDKIYDQNRGFEKESFDIILTNPPFGANIKREEKPYLDDYELGKERNSQKTEILFLERCFDFLKSGTGKLAIILPDGVLNNSSLQYVRDYIEQHFQILAVVSLPETAFRFYEAGVKPSILFLQKFSEEECSLYKASIDQITDENAAICTSRVKELENERKKVIEEHVSPAQVKVTELYELQFRTILDNIEDLNRKLNKKPIQTFLHWRERFIRDTSPEDSQGVELFDKRTANEQLKTHKKDLTALVKEYKEKYKAASDAEWESQIKEEYKEKINKMKEELADKNTDDIRQWIQKNANYQIFMAIAERIGYDATGRNDSINDLNTICEEYRKFADDSSSIGPVGTENPQCFVICWSALKDRLDSHFYHPRFERLLTVLRQSCHKVLGNIAKLSYQKWNPEEHPEETFRYIEIGNVSRQTGEVSFSELPTEDAPSRAQMVVQKDDIIVSLTRPHHGSIALIDDDLDGCIASTGFAVLREIKDTTLSRTYLYSTLRSQLCLDQMLQRSSGGNYPAITKERLMQILIPLPESEIQTQIADCIINTQKRVKRLRQEADAIVEQAKEKVPTRFCMFHRHERSPQSRFIHVGREYWRTHQRTAQPNDRRRMAEPIRCHRFAFRPVNSQRR